MNYCKKAHPQPVTLHYNSLNGNYYSSLCLKTMYLKTCDKNAKNNYNSLNMVSAVLTHGLLLSFDHFLSQLHYINVSILSLMLTSDATIIIYAPNQPFKFSNATLF